MDTIVVLGRVIALLAIAVGATPVLAQPARESDRAITYNAQSMGTLVTVTIWGHNEELAARGADAVFREFARVDKLMTTWVDDNDIAKVNKSGGGSPVAVDREIFDLLSFARDLNKKTDGTFDVTVGAFSGLWKFDQDKDGSVPTAAEVQKRLPLVGWDKLILIRKGRKVRLAKKGMKVTLGGIAKGYAVDRSVALLRGMGIDDFIVQAGGDLYASGKKGKSPWRVGIRDPRGGRDASFAVAAIENATFSTSGDYERFVIKDDQRYHHILDPRTGYPATKCRSVTVKAKNGVLAEIWSKALFILGPEKGLPLVEKLPDLDAVFVDADNKVHISSGLKEAVEMLHEPTPGL